MPALRACALVCALLLFVVPAVAQDKKPATELLPGKWEFKERQAGKEVHFFLVFEKSKDDPKSGTLKLEVTGVPSMDGNYSVVKDDEMEVSLKMGAEPQRQKLKFKFSNENNTLEITDELQKVERFNRVK